MTKTYCDRCEKEIKEDCTRITCEISKGFGYIDYYVFCKECGNEIIKQLDKKIK